MTKAESIAKEPTQALQDIIDSVQAAADHTQSEAYRYEDFPDGSRIEIRCYPKPASTGEMAPVAMDDVEGFLHETDDGRLFRATAAPVTAAGVRGSITRDGDAKLVVEGAALDDNGKPPEALAEWVAAHPSRSLRIYDDKVVPVEVAWEPVEGYSRRKPLLTPIQTHVKL